MNNVEHFLRKKNGCSFAANHGQKT